MLASSRKRQNAVWFLPLGSALAFSPNSQICLQGRGLSDVPDLSDVIDTAQGATVNLRKQFSALSSLAIHSLYKRQGLDRLISKL